MIVASGIFMVVAVAIFLYGRGLDHAAAWANILALPVGLIGLGLAALGLVPRARTDDTGPDRAPSPPAPVSETSRKQIGFAGRDQFNVAGGAVNIENHDGPR